MTDIKSDQLGLRGTLALMESALRLLGGANATGALASGVAYHAFAGNAIVQGAVKSAGIFFLFGILTFTVAYVSWFMTSLDIDRTLRFGETEGAVNEFFPTTGGSLAAYRRTAKITIVIMALTAIASLGTFLTGIMQVIRLSLLL
jgi:hypothetical protein